MTTATGSKKMAEYQSRYIAYAKAHKKSPELMLKRDQKKYPGGCMGGYIRWITSKWVEWKKMVGKPLNEPNFAIDHINFDAWLNKRGYKGKIK